MKVNEDDPCESCPCVTMLAFDIASKRGRLFLWVLLVSVFFGGFLAAP